jgi:hypothetical protein
MEVWAISDKELVGELNENTRTIPCIGIAPGSTTVKETFQDGHPFNDDIVGGFPLNITNHTYATGVVLLGWIVKTLRIWIISAVLHRFGGGLGALRR